MTLGLKLDVEKLPYHLQDDDAEAEMVAVLGYGAIKYEPGGWRHVDNAKERYYSALRRHLRAARSGELFDPEHGLLTLASAACNIHFLLGLELQNNPSMRLSLHERYGQALEIARKLRAEREKK